MGLFSKLGRLTSSGLDRSRKGHAVLGRSAERATLDTLLESVRSGRGQVLVLRGEPGVGKTTLLDHSGRRERWVCARARRGSAVRDGGVASLHQLCLPLLDGLGALPIRSAMRSRRRSASTPATRRTASSSGSRS